MQSGPSLDQGLKYLPVRSTRVVARQPLKSVWNHRHTPILDLRTLPGPRSRASDTTPSTSQVSLGAGPSLGLN